MVDCIGTSPPTLTLASLPLVTTILGRDNVLALPSLMSKLIVLTIGLDLLNVPILSQSLEPFRFFERLSL